MKLFGLERVVNFMKLDLYDRIAVFEPAVVNLFLFILALLAVCTAGFQQMPNFGILESILTLIFSVAIVAILARFIMNLFRNISKVFIQNFIYGRHQLSMPTTEYMLLTSKWGSRRVKLSVRKKVREDFGVDLPTEEEELADETEARNCIVEVVGRIRAYLRTKVSFKNLKMYNKKNRRYGYVRNFMGGFIFFLLIYPILIIYSFYCARVAFFYVLGIFVFHLLIFGCHCFFLKNDAEDYAHELFVTYLNN